MIRPDVAKWEQTTNDLRLLATESAHVRTRERFLALYIHDCSRAVERDALGGANRPMRRVRHEWDPQI